MASTIATRPDCRCRRRRQAIRKWCRQMSVQLQLNIVAANTTMLLPYFAIVGAFDTGIAISNTTADAFGVAGGGANPSAGTIKVDIFPTAQGGGAETTVSLTTSATARPGAGLSSDGTLAAGEVWTAFMSQILT